MGLFLVSIVGLFLSACITNWDYNRTICLTGVFMGAWLVYTGHKIFGGALLAFCGFGFAYYSLFA